MTRDSDSERKSDAQILATLRRRPAASTAPAESNADTESQARADNRAEALKRLVTSNAPKEPISATSSTFRDLREELNSDVVSANTFDASLDLIEAELESNAAQTSPVSHSSDRSPAVENDAMSAVELKNAWIPSEPAVAASEPRKTLELRSDKKAEVSDLLVVSELHKGYVKGKKLIPVLQGVNLTVSKGELLAVVGQSGSGKSTLLHLMGTLDVPDSGTIHFDGQRIDNLPSSQRDVLRNRFIGMIFQFYHLIPEMSTLENVLAPLMIRDSIFGYLRKRSQYVEHAKELLDLVGLSHRLRHRPNELSGGEMQRASIARALITNPRVLLADEPTGNLDSKSSLGVLELLRKLNQEKNLTIVMVTHDMNQAQSADRAVRIVDGWIVPE